MSIKEMFFIKKGWSVQEIEHAKEILNKQQTQKTHEKISILAALIVIIIGTVCAVWSIELIIAIATEIQAKSIMIVMGLLLGLLLVNIEKDIDAINQKHHLLISIVVPVVAIVTSLIIGFEVNIITSALELEKHNPITLGLFFSIGCLSPFFIYTSMQRKKT